MTSRRTGPRRLPTWTVADGVFESLMTCGPLTLAASSSAQSTALADADDRVGEVAGGDLDDDLLALLLAEEGGADRALVADPTLGRFGLGRSDDREGLLAVVAHDGDRRADLDVIRGVVLVDDRGVLDQRLERLDPTLDERLLVLCVLVLRVLREVSVLLGVVDSLGDLGSLDGGHRVQLGAQLLEAVFREVGGSVVHGIAPPMRCGPVGGRRSGGQISGKNFRLSTVS